MNRSTVLVLSLFATGGLVLPACVRLPVKLLWNATASAPVGLYFIRNAEHVKVGDLVLIRPASPLAELLSKREYLPLNVPLLKHVVALSGQTACREGLRIKVNELTLGFAQERDSRDRVLPAWSGCHLLKDGEIFVMNPKSPDSLDSRYFGPMQSSAIIGAASPIWTWDTVNPRSK